MQYVYVCLFSHGFIYCCIKYHSILANINDAVFLISSGFFGSGPGHGFAGSCLAAVSISHVRRETRGVVHS